MAVVRAAKHAVPATALAEAVTDRSLDDPAQRDRALASLLADGLLEQHSNGDYALPG
jgi:hypothetical protein